MFSKASQVLRGGKMGERTQSQPHFKEIGKLYLYHIINFIFIEEKNTDSSKKQRKGNFWFNIE